MKRILALFLVFILIFSITACGMNTSEKPYDGETMSGTEENSNVSTEEMLSDVPDTYDYALQVSINPEFILYLVGSEVVAYGALNEDAKKVDERAAIEDSGLHGALEDIVRFSYEEGFLKDGGDVTVTMVRAFGTEAVSKGIKGYRFSYAENTNEYHFNAISDEWNVCVYDSVRCRIVLFCI